MKILINISLLLIILIMPQWLWLRKSTQIDQILFFLISLNGLVSGAFQSRAMVLYRNYSSQNKGEYLAMLSLGVVFFLLSLCSWFGIVVSNGMFWGFGILPALSVLILSASLFTKLQQDTSSYKMFLGL